MAERPEHTLWDDFIATFTRIRDIQEFNRRLMRTRSEIRDGASGTDHDPQTGVPRRHTIFGLGRRTIITFVQNERTGEPLEGHITRVSFIGRRVTETQYNPDGTTTVGLHQATRELHRLGRYIR